MIRAHRGSRASWFTACFALLALAGCDDSGGQTDPTDTSTIADLRDGVAVPDGTVVTDTGTTPDQVVTPTTVVGSACADAADCNGGICVSTLPGGYCSASCDGDASLCEAGSSCRLVNDFPFCLRECVSNDDCRTDDGYSCLDGICDIECENIADCDDGFSCSNGICIEQMADRILNAPCEDSGECVSGVCLPPAQGGVCGEACSAGNCTLADWSCQDIVPVGENVAFRVCAPDPDINTEVIELTPQQFTYSFDVDESVISFEIVVKGDNHYADYLAFNLTNPNGFVVDGYPNQFGAPGFLRTAPGTGQASILVPNNNDASLQIVPGTWSFAADRIPSSCQVGCPPGIACVNGGCQTPGLIESVQVFLKRAGSGGEPSAATLDVNMYFPAGIATGLNANSAATDFEIQRSIERMEEFWGEHGISVGTVRYFDIPSSFATVSDPWELRDMFANESSGPDDAVNVFFVRRLDGHGPGTVGIAGGIPGPMGVTGTGGSGVAVTLLGAGNYTGDNMTHELGHWLGLYHVDQIQFDYPDVISDTPSCSGDGRNYEACMDNIMYPSLLTGLVPQEFTPQQARLFRLSPIAR